MTSLLLPGSRLVVATHNDGKLREFRELLAPFRLDLVSAGELGLPEPEETGTTFAENARIKAEAAMRASGLPALADDSGLAVMALWGAPGVFSARWAGPDKDFGAAMKRIEDELHARGAVEPEQRRAAFVCALCLAHPADEPDEVEGFVVGTLVWPPRGLLGFGYDPMFQPEGHERTFGEMSADEKHGVDWAGLHGLSHRARAFIALGRTLFPGASAQMSAEAGFGIYVHWPFCAAKCPYCDFNSHVRHQPVDETRFAAAFAREIAYFGALTPRRTVGSIFLGGGTPSLMKPRTVAAILEAIAKTWPVATNVEITLEANPSSVEASRFAGYRAAGVNRVSLGVQSFTTRS